MYRLRTAIVENRIRDIGKIQPYEKKINLNADRKRHWLTRLESMNSKEPNLSIPLHLQCPTQEGYIIQQI